MRLIALLLISFCIYSCKEKPQEYDAELDLKQSSFHLEGGLCVGKYRKCGHLENKPCEWIIRFYSCFDSLPEGTELYNRREIECDYGTERKQIDCRQD